MENVLERRKMRLLCLHGYTQTADIFRSKTGSLRKALKDLADFTVVDAPHRIRPEDEARFEVPADGDALGWYIPNYQTVTYRGVEEGIDYIRNIIASEGPFDGLLGFSQGASLVGALCALQRKQPAQSPRFRFAIMISGFRLRDPRYAAWYDEKIDIPSLHIFGETDGVIPCAWSEQLAASFVDPSIYRHPGGHFVPAQASQRAIYQDFLTKMANS